MSERIIAAAMAVAMFAIVGLFVSEYGQSRVAGVFPKGTPHYIYKRAALTAIIMATAGVQGAVRLPAVFGFDDPTRYKLVQFEPWQAMLFILLLCVFFTPFYVRVGLPRRVPAAPTSIVIEDDGDEEDDGWDDLPVMSAEEVIRRAKATNEIHVGRGRSAPTVSAADGDEN